MPTNNFKSTTTYRFRESDEKFIFDLAKIGSVHVLSNQVVLTDDKAGKKGEYENHSITFASYGTNEKDCEGLVLPEGWIIEGVYSNESALKITFKVKF